MAYDDHIYKWRKSFDSDSFLKKYAMTLLNLLIPVVDLTVFDASSLKTSFRNLLMNNIFIWFARQPAIILVSAIGTCHDTM